MTVSAEVIVVMLDDDKLTVTYQSTAAVYHLARFSGDHGLPPPPRDLDALATRVT